MDQKIYHNVPEGYFEDLKTRLSAIPQEEHASGWERLRPYVALAAAFVAIVTVGTAVLRLSTCPAAQDYDDFGIAEIIPSTDSYIYYSSEVSEEPVSSEDDILEYLLNSNTSVEQIAYLGNEN
ncbi:MAG: hypothetical protein IKR88_09220 [Bacteroidales bacterium]|nr:hypothetical protein [Bacteroidales bacterium]